MGRLSGAEALSLLSLSFLSFVVMVTCLRDNDELIYASLALSTLGFAATYYGIRYLGDNFLKRGWTGRDMSKIKRTELPEMMGVVPALVHVFFVQIFLFCVFHNDPTVALFRQQQDEVALERRRNKIYTYYSAIGAVLSIIILGVIDDRSDVRWRFKMPIPALAAIPMLAVYYKYWGVTNVVVPVQLEPYFGNLVDLGWLYYAYMAAVAIFCTHSINILAGINGIEVSQSIVIAALLLANDVLSLLAVPNSPVPHPATELHLFSIYLLLPFIGVSLALWWHNWYPAKVFVGDTYCYFAGMLFASVGILGHFSKTLLLLFIPQIANFLYSTPQLFHLIPCPRHRLPHFNARTGLLEPSVTKWSKPPSPTVALSLKTLSQVPVLPLIRLETNSRGEITESTNLTILNLWLVWRGPKREDRLAIEILLLQVSCGILGLFMRHKLALLVFREDNRL